MSRCTNRPYWVPEQDALEAAFQCGHCLKKHNYQQLALDGVPLRGISQRIYSVFRNSTKAGTIPDT